MYSWDFEDIDSSQDAVSNSSMLKSISNEEDIKCLLIFSKHLETFQKLEYLIQAFQARQNTKITVGGVKNAHDSNWIRENITDDNSTMHCNKAVAFCGESVEVASLTISSLDCRETMEQKLRKFQAIEKKGKKCITFMFRNSIHASKYYGECNYESSIFRELFPSVPLIGVFGKGVIGSNTFTGDPENPLFIKVHNSENGVRNPYIHETVFVFIAV